MARTLTNTLKAPPYNVEIYIVALDVCGNNDPSVTASSNYCGAIGDSAGDNTADRRLLKCIATSTTGTNDHYFEIEEASEIPAIFQQIAYGIASRSLIE
jgi:hypothetical protein